MDSGNCACVRLSSSLLWTTTWPTTTTKKIRSHTWLLEGVRCCPTRTSSAELSYYGISGNIHAWIPSFLKNRSQCLRVDGARLDKIPIGSGVPQGTVVGPLLFLLYITDLPDEVSSHVHIFCRWLPTTIQAYQIRRISSPSATRPGLPLTLSVGTTKKFTTFYSLCGCILSQASHSKYLWVTLSEDLQCDLHISSVAARANQTLGFLCRNLKGCPAALKKLAYFWFVQSKLEYASSA